jgi:hypothetical protein
VAGTERGITEPEATFSACFGAAFLTLHPTKYADLLQKKLQKHDTATYLINTGWTGGPYGVGKRMSIKATRACIDAILDGSIKSAKFDKVGMPELVHLPRKPPGPCGQTPARGCRRHCYRTAPPDEPGPFPRLSCGWSCLACTGPGVWL